MLKNSKSKKLEKKRAKYWMKSIFNSEDATCRIQNKLAIHQLNEIVRSEYVDYYQG
jgi:hypothetical protein